MVKLDGVTTLSPEVYCQVSLISIETVHRKLKRRPTHEHWNYLGAQSQAKLSIGIQTYLPRLESLDIHDVQPR